MTKLGKALIQAAKEARAIARGEMDSRTYRVHIPPEIDVKRLREKLANDAARVRSPVRLQVSDPSRLGTEAQPPGRARTRLLADNPEGAEGRIEGAPARSPRGSKVKAARAGRLKREGQEPSRPGNSVDSLLINLRRRPTVGEGTGAVSFYGLPPTKPSNNLACLGISRA